MSNRVPCSSVYVVIFFKIIHIHDIIITGICVCGIWNNQGLGKCYQEIITFSLTITRYCSLIVCLLTAKLLIYLFCLFFF